MNFASATNAERYYKSGKSFLYRTLPFWVASLADRMLVVLVPLIVVLIPPGLRLMSGLYRWGVKSRIYRWYGVLIAIEREAISGPDTSQRDALLERIDVIETSVNRMKMPLVFADQFYVLEHIGFVRQRLAQAPATTHTTDAGHTAHDDTGYGGTHAEPPAEHPQGST